MASHSEQSLLNSWQNNSLSWVKAIRNNEIESRRLVTNKAIHDEILAFPQSSIIDIGCGEGWLTRMLFSKGYSVTGIDATKELIDVAIAGGGGDFITLKYEDISPEYFNTKFDLAVSNFSLLGEDSVNVLFKALPRILTESGCLIIQTVHPFFVSLGADYIDGWREESWGRFSNESFEPSPWYFRTVESWIELFVQNRFSIVKIKEPLNPNTQKPESLIIIGVLT